MQEKFLLHHLHLPTRLVVVVVQVVAISKIHSWVKNKKLLKKTKLPQSRNNVQVAHPLSFNIEIDAKIIDKIVLQSIESIKTMKEEGIKITIAIDKDKEAAHLNLLETIEEI